MTCSWCWGTRPTLTNLGVKFTRMQSRNIFKNKSIFCRLFLPRPVFFNYYTFTRFFPCLILPHLILIDHYFPFKSMVYQLFVNILHCVDFFIILYFSHWKTSPCVFFLKGLYWKNERGYRIKPENLRFWTILSYKTSILCSWPVL